jgi:isoaspartyl peptidase/L-asparaginase-like protein (Ntn-hydrolase superfamily)
MKPIAISTWWFGEQAVLKAGELLREGANSLDAVEEGIKVVEDNPEVTSVGYGGLPNSEGYVELDAAIMHGPTHDAGSVAGLRYIKNPISVARKVMELTKHLMLVGEGALKFALECGFRKVDLLTEKSRDRWERWRRSKEQADSHDTVSLIVLDREGDLTVGCSTSGLAYKLPGRVGDSPIVGAGVYVDNEVGAAAATGVGEEIIKFCGSFLIVEKMREGLSPQEACEYVVRRILAKKPEDREIMAAFIALSREGSFGAAATKDGFTYAVWRYPDTAFTETPAAVCP